MPIAQATLEKEAPAGAAERPPGLDPRPQSLTTMSLTGLVGSPVLHSGNACFLRVFIFLSQSITRKRPCMSYGGLPEDEAAEHNQDWSQKEFSAPSKRQIMALTKQPTLLKDATEMQVLVLEEYRIFYVNCGEPHSQWLKDDL